MTSDNNDNSSNNDNPLQQLKSKFKIPTLPHEIEGDTAINCGLHVFEFLLTNQLVTEQDLEPGDVKTTIILSKCLMLTRIWKTTQLVPVNLINFYLPMLGCILYQMPPEVLDDLVMQIKRESVGFDLDKTIPMKQSDLEGKTIEEMDVIVESLTAEKH